MRKLSKDFIIKTLQLCFKKINKYIYIFIKLILNWFLIKKGIEFLINCF